MRVYNLYKKSVGLVVYTRWYSAYIYSMYMRVYGMLGVVSVCVTGVACFLF